jgi:hypothetical protein
MQEFDMRHVVAFAVAFTLLIGARGDFASFAHAESEPLGGQVVSSGTLDGVIRPNLCWICPTT